MTLHLSHPKVMSELLPKDYAARVDAAYTILALACVANWCPRFDQP